MSTQSTVLKFAALALTIVLSWLVTHYITEGIVLDTFVKRGQLLETMWKRVLFSMKCFRSTPHAKQLATIGESIHSSHSTQTMTPGLETLDIYEETSEPV